MTDQANITESSSPFVNVLGRVFAALGFVLFVSYLIYLPFPKLFDVGVIADVGLVMYSLASAGAAMVAWGNIMASLNSASVKKSTVLKASGLGFLLLGVMRLGTATFPHAPFEELIMVAVTEGLIFIAIAIKLLRSN